MKLTSLSVQGVRGVPDGQHELASGGSPKKLVLVTGPRGAGLTSFLDSIAFTAARLSTQGFVPSSDDVLHAKATTATIRSTWWLDDAERQYAGLVDGATEAEVVFKLGALGHVHADPGLLGLMSRYDHAGVHSKVVYVPQQRVTNDVAAPLSDFEADQRRQQFSADPARFAGVPRALINEATRSSSPERFEKVQKLFDEMSESARLTRVYNGALEFSSGGTDRVPFRKLSFSERDTLVLAAVTVLWGLSNAVVLLDTPEQACPTAPTSKWLERMMEHAPNSQWIVATRSEELLASHDARSIVTLGRSN